MPVHLAIIRNMPWPESQRAYRVGRLECRVFLVLFDILKLDW